MENVATYCQSQKDQSWDHVRLIQISTLHHSWPVPPWQRPKRRLPCFHWPRWTDAPAAAHSLDVRGSSSSGWTNTTLRVYCKVSTRHCTSPIFTCCLKKWANMSHHFWYRLSWRNGHSFYWWPSIGLAVSVFTPKQVFGPRTAKSQSIWIKFCTHLLLYGIHLWADLDRNQCVCGSRPNQNDCFFFCNACNAP